jgi:hypothetical protein
VFVEKKLKEGKSWLHFNLIGCVETRARLSLFVSVLSVCYSMANQSITSLFLLSILFGLLLSFSNAQFFYSLRYQALGPTIVSLNWGADYSSSSQLYQLYMNGEQLTVVHGTYFVFDQVVPAQSYTAQVISIDSNSYSEIISFSSWYQGVCCNSKFALFWLYRAIFVLNFENTDIFSYLYSKNKAYVQWQPRSVDTRLQMLVEDTYVDVPSTPTNSSRYVVATISYLSNIYRFYDPNGPIAGNPGVISTCTFDCFD